MLKQINYSNGYIEIYSSHYFAYNYTQKRAQMFETYSIWEYSISKYSISEIKRKMNLK
jgi:hypothetical protein